MKKIIITCLIAVLIATGSFSRAAEKLILNDGKTDLVLTENETGWFAFRNTIASFNYINVQTEMGTFSRLVVPGYTFTHETGKPAVSQKVRLIEIPHGATYHVDIKSMSYTDYKLEELGISHRLMPAQPPMPKDGDIPPFEMNAAAYEVDAFYPKEQVRIENTGILRGLQIGRLVVSPLQYNPTTGVIRVYNEIEATVTFEDVDFGRNIVEKRKTEGPYYHTISKHLFNYLPMQGRDTICDYPLTYVIVSDPMFESQLQPFIEWKTKKGFNVIEAYTDDPLVGNTKFQIKTYLQDLYENPGAGNPPPSFVLFVGDIEQIPTWNGNAGSHVTDLFYCEYTNDYFPEVFYGRMSAKNADHLQPQIDKTLQYEQYTMPDPGYLNEVVMIAGVDGSFGASHANGQINYGTINYFNETNGILSHTYLYPESGSHSADIIQDISNGVTYGNYTAHCSPNGWADPSFSIGDIQTLQNVDKYGLLVGNCCSSSEYQQTECFGEEIVRAVDKGAVAYVGASNSTYWDEDYYWGVGVGAIAENPPPYEETSLGMYDRVWHTHGEPWEDWYTTSDQMIYAGNLAVTEGSASMAEYYWEAYCVMGDPSLSVYFSVPGPIAVSHLPILILNSSSFTVNTEPYAYVAISKNGTLHGAALADEDGVAEVPLEPITVPGTTDVVVTKQNGEPYIGTVLAANPEGPYIILNDSEETDLNGNLNGNADCGEIITLEIELKNWGNSDGVDVLSTLETTDPYVTITDATEYTGLISSQDSITLKNAFSFIIDPNIPDNHDIFFNIITTDISGEEWLSETVITAFAPDFVIDGIEVDDSEGGNGNGRLDPGESADVTITCANLGHIGAPDTEAILSSHSGFVDIPNPVQQLGFLGLLGNKTATFEVTVDNDAPSGILAGFNISLQSGEIEFNNPFSLRIGMVSEDFETGDFTAFGWQPGGNTSWGISMNYPYAGLFSAKSGEIENGENSTLSLTYQVMKSDSISFIRKVSSESQDKLKFFINNELMAEWSGTTGGWKRACFPVASGTNTFKWSYQKDGSGASGADCAWLDNIIFPQPLVTTLFAGLDSYTCGDEGYQLQGEATHYSSVEWQTSGTGTFSDMAILQPVYTPSQDDIDNGLVILTLQVFGTEGDNFSDELVLTIEGDHVQPGTPEGPENVDLTEVFISEYTTAGIPEINEYQWSVDPAGAGTFTGSGLAGTIVWERNFSGEALISVAGINSCGPGSFSETLTVVVDNIFVETPELPASSTMINIFPNPSSGAFNIRLNAVGGDQLQLKLIDLTGRQVWEQQILGSGKQEIRVSTGKFPAGIYILNIQGTHSREIRKVILQ